MAVGSGTSPTFPRRRHSGCTVLPSGARLMRYRWELRPQRESFMGITAPLSQARNSAGPKPNAYRLTVRPHDPPA